MIKDTLANIILAAMLLTAIAMLMLGAADQALRMECTAQDGSFDYECYDRGGYPK